MSPRQDDGNSGARARHVSLQSNGDTHTSDPDNYSTTHDTYYRKFDTSNLKTFGRNTHEAIAHLDFYRNTANTPQYTRPTLEQLQEEKVIHYDELQDCYSLIFCR